MFNLKLATILLTSEACYDENVHFSSWKSRNKLHFESIELIDSQSFDVHHFSPFILSQVIKFEFFSEFYHSNNNMNEQIYIFQYEIIKKLF